VELEAKEFDADEFVARIASQVEAAAALVLEHVQPLDGFEPATATERQQVQAISDSLERARTAPAQLRKAEKAVIGLLDEGDGESLKTAAEIGAAALHDAQAACAGFQAGVRAISLLTAVVPASV
jgi:hypothetical protein